MSSFLSSVALLTIMWLVTAYTLMLGVGIVHAEWISGLPTIGFGLALLLATLGVARAVVAAIVSELMKLVNGGS